MNEAEPLVLRNAICECRNPFYVTGAVVYPGLVILCVPDCYVVNARCTCGQSKTTYVTILDEAIQNVSEWLSLFH